jgi:hypothetical protein
LEFSIACRKIDSSFESNPDSVNRGGGRRARLLHSLNEVPTQWGKALVAWRLPHFFFSSAPPAGEPLLLPAAVAVLLLAGDATAAVAAEEEEEVKDEAEAVSSSSPWCFTCVFLPLNPFASTRLLLLPPPPPKPRPPLESWSSGPSSSFFTPNIMDAAFSM